MTEYGTTTIPFKIENPDLDFQLNGQYVVGSGADLPINYEDDNQLENRPQINNKELIGNKSSQDLGLQDEMEYATVQEIERILYID